MRAHKHLAWDNHQNSAMACCVKLWRTSKGTARGPLLRARTFRHTRNPQTPGGCCATGTAGVQLALVAAAAHPESKTGQTRTGQFGTFRTVLAESPYSARGERPRVYKHGKVPVNVPSVDVVGPIAGIPDMHSGFRALNLQPNVLSSGLFATRTSTILPVLLVGVAEAWHDQ